MYKRQVVAAAAEHHTLLEINSSSLHSASMRLHAKENYRIMLDLCKHYKASVIIDSDAHIEADVGNHKLAWELICETGFPEELIVNGSLDRLLPYIPRLKAVSYTHLVPIDFPSILIVLILAAIPLLVKYIA